MPNLKLLPDTLWNILFPITISNGGLYSTTDTLLRKMLQLMRDRPTASLGHSFVGTSRRHRSGVGFVLWSRQSRKLQQTMVNLRPGMIKERDEVIEELVISST